MMYIYTSGTTGLPKAAVLKHSRFLFAVYALYTMTHLSEEEVLYSPLPMYHTAAGALVTGNAMYAVIHLINLIHLTTSLIAYPTFHNIHLTPGSLVTSFTRVGGMKMVTRKKFSAKSFWKDCKTEGVTVGHLGL